jgi:hypothetical protein
VQILSAFPKEGDGHQAGRIDFRQKNFRICEQSGKLGQQGNVDKPISESEVSTW